MRDTTGTDALADALVLAYRRDAVVLEATERLKAIYGDGLSRQAAEQVMFGLYRELTGHEHPSRRLLPQERWRRLTAGASKGGKAGADRKKQRKVFDTVLSALRAMDQRPRSTARNATELFRSIEGIDERYARRVVTQIRPTFAHDYKQARRESMRKASAPVSVLPSRSRRIITG